MNALQQQQSRRLATPTAAGAPAASCSTSRVFGALSRGGPCHQLRRVTCSVASAEETRSTVSICAFSSRNALPPAFLSRFVAWHGRASTRIAARGAGGACKRRRRPDLLPWVRQCDLRRHVECCVQVLELPQVSPQLLEDQRKAQEAQAIIKARQERRQR